jgi:hypothetical protein
MTAAKRISVVAALAVFPVLLSGCVVVNVGEPVSFTREMKTVDTSAEKLLAVAPEFDGRGSNATVRLCKTVQPITKVILTRVNIRSQKRIAVGLFPGWGMRLHKPSSGFQPDWVLAQPELYACYHVPKGTAALLCSVFATPYTLLVTPFTEWTALVNPRGPKGYTRMGFGDIKDLGGVFSYRELADCGIGMRGDLAVLGLAGVVKYPDVFVTSEKLGTQMLPESGTNVQTSYVGGPFEVELRIPEVGFCQRKTVRKYESRVDFTLPTDYRAEEMEPCKGKWGVPTQRRRRYQGLLTFRDTGPHDNEQEVWSQADGRSFEIELCLEKGGSYMNPPGRAVVKEGPFHPEPRVVEVRKPDGPPYNVEKTVDGEGRTVWRVKILAENLNAFAVDREAKPQILEELREDFAGRNPDVPRGEINAWAAYTTEDGGRTLVYVGVAESLIPSLESLTYSAEARRGTVTMRLAGRADLRRSKEFVRNNISAIVCDKNVVLTAGERPPDGATYRSLDENFADGVLTVEFEAVE